MPKKILISLIIFLIVFCFSIFNPRKIGVIEAQGPIAAMKTRVSGNFYVPKIGPKSLKVVFLFDNPNLEGDQTGGASGEYPIMPDGTVDIFDLILINGHQGQKEGDPGWEYMADVNGDGTIDIFDQIIIGNNMDKSGSYISDLSGVTVEFNTGNICTLDGTDSCNIPSGATNFTVKKNGSPIGAYILFYAESPQKWPHISIQVSPSIIKVGDEFTVFLTYTHDLPEPGSIHLRWLDDKFDITNIEDTGCSAGYVDNPPYAPGWEGIECNNVAHGTTKAFTLKALKEGEQTLYYRAWDSSQDYDCGGGKFDYNRDPESGTCSTNCDSFPSDWAVCDAYSLVISVGAPAPGCTCNSWANDACGVAGCAANQMHQTRTCNPAGCDIESQCVANPACAPQVKTCAQLGGTCCPAGQTCTAGKISGASDCSECCSDVANCQSGGEGGESGGSSFFNIINPLACNTIPECIEKIISFILWIGTAIFPIIIIIGGFLFLISGGDPEKVRTAKRMIFWAVIGLAIVLIARGIISVIKSVITK